VCESDIALPHPEELGYYVRRIDGQFAKHRRLELKQYDLTSSQFDVLFWIMKRQQRENLDTIQKDIERYFHISNPSVSGIISRLEQKGFVERVRSDKDRRICHIQPTEKARAMQKTLCKAHRDMEERIRSEYGRGPYEQLMKELNRLLTLLTEIVKEESAC